MVLVVQLLCLILRVAYLRTPAIFHWTSAAIYLALDWFMIHRADSAALDRPPDGEVHGSLLIENQQQPVL
jgi:hypothetical protein